MEKKKKDNDKTNEKSNKAGVKATVISFLDDFTTAFFNVISFLGICLMVYFVCIYAFPEGEEGIVPGYFTNKFIVATMAAAVCIAMTSIWTLLTRGIFSAKGPFNFIKIVVIGYFVIVGIGIVITLIM